MLEPVLFHLHVHEGRGSILQKLNRRFATILLTPYILLMKKCYLVTGMFNTPIPFGQIHYYDL